MRNTIIFLIVSLVSFALVASIGIFVVQNGILETNLTAVTLRESISESLQPTASTLNTNVRDYSLTDENYFENQEWVVVKVSDSSAEPTDPALLILQNQNNKYEIVLGPGTAFPESLIKDVPQSVADYLRSQGAIYKEGE